MLWDRSARLNLRWRELGIFPVRIALLSLARQQAFELLLVSAENMLFAAREVRVDLTGEEGVLGDVGAAGILVEGKEKQPDDAGDNAK